MADGIIFRPPAPVLSVIGWENDAAISGGVVLSLPVATVSTGNLEGAQLALPSPQLSIDGYAGYIDFLGTALQVSPVIATTGITGISGDVTLYSPSLAISVSDPDAVLVRLPIPNLAIQAQTGAVGTVGFNIPGLQLAGVGAIPFVAASALSIRPALVVSGTSGSAATIDMALRQMALAASGYSGIIGRTGLTLPVIDVSAGGYEQEIGTAVMSIPMLILQATGVQIAVSPGANASTVVMHTETQAVTRYNNYPFNSFAKFNGIYLGAKDDGIFALTGANDNGTIIQAAARVGITDMSTSHLKRVDRMYIGHKADGDLILRVTTDDNKIRDYRMRALGLSGAHTNIVKFGRGLEARYWQFELRNENGSDFELDAMEFKPFILKRRLWSKP